MHQRSSKQIARKRPDTLEKERTEKQLARQDPNFKANELARLGTHKTGLSPPSIFILTVPRRYFCCGSLLFLQSVFILWFSYYISDIFCKF